LWLVEQIAAPALASAETFHLRRGRRSVFARVKGTERKLGASGDIQQKLKIVLDETRMSVMGVQILIGFQFQAIVQETFATMSASSKTCLASALILMIVTGGLLMAPAAQHRLVERGEATPRIIALTERCIEVALLLFAIGLALDGYIAFEHIADRTAGISFAAAAFIAAIVFWFALGFLYRGGAKKKERAMASASADTPLSKKIDYMLTESRVLLPGVQALLGFQLIAVLTRTFQGLPTALKVTHLAALALMTLAIVFLLAPAAFHRVAYSGEDAEPVHRFGSAMVTAASAALGLGLSAEVFVAIAAISGKADLGVLLALLTLLALAILWYVWPLVIRARQQGGGSAQHV
jgi:Family of unknown function (DUF6328)